MDTVQLNVIALFPTAKQKITFTSMFVGGPDIPAIELKA